MLGHRGVMLESFYRVLKEITKPSKKRKHRTYIKPKDNTQKKRAKRLNQKKSNKKRGK